MSITSCKYGVILKFTEAVYTWLQIYLVSFYSSLKMSIPGWEEGIILKSVKKGTVSF